MAGSYAEPITIEDAVRHIIKNEYLLPAIQRKFIWRPEQICSLFDSIMRGYPINSFMFWEVTTPRIANDFRFFQFLKNYCERFGEDNPDLDTKGLEHFWAVIDGQQRLTSLYIGLKGTYAYKLPRKWWPSSKNSEILPERKLYLNIASPLEDEQAEDKIQYEFRFLAGEISEKIWFKVGDIFCIDTKYIGKKATSTQEIHESILYYLKDNDLETNSYAFKTLYRLYTSIRTEKIINYYNETSTEIDDIVSIFIRTNHGGSPLSFSDLLISIAIANFQDKDIDIRKDIDNIVSEAGSKGFHITRDFVLKTALAVSGNDIQFKVKNFNRDKVESIVRIWKNLQLCFNNTFELIKSFGLTDAALRAKNALIPIVYYVFHKTDTSHEPLYKTINNPAKNKDERKKICQWLHMSLLKGTFGGHSDTTLATLRRILRSNLSDTKLFPLENIIEHFRGTSKDMTFTDDFIDRLLKTQKEHPSCFSILALLYPDLDFSQALDIDHIHPAAGFRKAVLAKHDWGNNPERRTFYEAPENWNGIANLQLLNASENKAKQDMDLSQWIQKNPSRFPMLYVSEDTDLGFDAFEKFIATRRRCLKQKLQQLVISEDRRA